MVFIGLQKIIIPAALWFDVRTSFENRGSALKSVTAIAIP